MINGGGRRYKRGRNEGNVRDGNNVGDTKHTSYSSASCVPSYSSASSSMSRTSSAAYSQEREEARKRYPMFTVEYAKRYERGNVPFLQVLPQQKPLLPILRLQHSPPSSSPLATVSPRLVLYNEYEFLRELGKGTYSKVVLCHSLRSGAYCALKVFRNENNYREACWDEMGVMEALCCPVVGETHNHSEQPLDDNRSKHNHYHSTNAYNNQNRRNEFGVGMSPIICNGVLSASTEYQGRVGRFNIPIAHLPHPVHHAIVFPALGLSLLDVLRNIRKGVSVAVTRGSNTTGTVDNEVPPGEEEMSEDDSDHTRLPFGVVEVHYRGMPISLLRSVVYQILLFLRHAHRRDIVHTDLKPENVLFESTETLPTRVSVMKRRYSCASPPSTENCTEKPVNETSHSSTPADRNCPALSSSSALLPSGLCYTTTSTTVDALLPVIDSVRVIDFGAAEFLSKSRHVSVLDGTTRVFHHRIHTTHYRSVEVLLGLGWTASADVWSLGSMIPELLTGECVFMPRDDLEHLALMQRVIGEFNTGETEMPPRRSTIVSRVFAQGRHFKEFFDPHTMQLAWPARSPAEGRNTGGRRTATMRREEGLPRRVRPDVLEKDVRYVMSRPTLQQILEPYPLLYDLCRRMLDYDPLRRITATEALQHPFFTTPI